MPPTTVVRTYLQLLTRDDLRSKRLSDPVLSLRLEQPCAGATYRRLYEDVGRDYHWRDRLIWSEERLAAHLARPEIGVWILRLADDVVGYFELERHPDESVEIAYFGLRSAYHGRGFGAHLLTLAVEEAWRSSPARVWLHTCTLDGPAALPNYLARGFVPFRTEEYQVDIAGKA